MTWISCFWAHSCQSVLNNENRKLVCVESLCYCGVTRHNKTEALLYVGWTAWRRKGYLRTDYTSTTPRPWTALRCGNWQWFVRNHLLPWDCRDISQHLLSAPTYVSCTWVWDCEENMAVGKGISELPLEHLGAVYQTCRAAGLPSSVVPTGRWKVSRTRQRMCPSYGRYWEWVAKRSRESSLFIGKTPCKFDCDCIRKFAPAFVQANLFWSIPVFPGKLRVFASFCSCFTTECVQHLLKTSTALF